MASRRDKDAFRYVVSRSLLQESAVTLRSMSGGVRESVILWTGTAGDEEALVRRIAVPRQSASAKHFDVPLDERLKLAQRLLASGEKLLVQLHTHPRQAFHSLADDQLALPRHTGALSIVIPNFASRWSGDLCDTSVNRHLGGGVWEELSPEAVARLFEVRR